MSCLAPGYDPSITRAWSRVQHSCTYPDTSGNTSTSTIYVPILKKYVPVSSVASELAMLNKGNILQYKKNSSNLTKKQRFAKIAQGQWTNRTTCWATQTVKYTEPNTRLLKRVNIPNNIYLNGTVTSNPITCDTTTPKDEIIIAQGGVLLCNEQENPCTGVTIKQPPRELCHPTSASDVPGKIIPLCYNDSLPTYYPRQQYTMNTSGDKWPQGYKDLISGNDIPSV